MFVDHDNVTHQGEIKIQNEMEDLFAIKKGVSAEDEIFLEGIRQVRDGDTVQHEDHQSEQVAAHFTYDAR